MKCVSFFLGKIMLLGLILIYLKKNKIKTPETRLNHLILKIFDKKFNNP